MRLNCWIAIVLGVMLVVESRAQPAKALLEDHRYTEAIDQLRAEDDQGAESNEATVTITVNDDSSIDTNAGLTISQGDRVSITTSELSASDPDDDASDLTYSISNGPSQGDLLVNGSQQSTFTQQDLIAGNVEYDHTASNATDDSFDFDVMDSDGASTSVQTFSITVSSP